MAARSFSTSSALLAQWIFLYIYGGAGDVMLGCYFGYIVYQLQWKRHSGENNEMLHGIGTLLNRRSKSQ